MKNGETILDYLSVPNVIKKVPVRERQEDQSESCGSGSIGTERKIRRCYVAGFEDGG